MSPIDLRRWLVEKVVLSPEAKIALKGMEPPDDLIQLAGGRSPSPEHTGVAARLLYEYMGHQDLVLSRIPSLRDPKTWNQAPSMAHLLMWLWEPWKQVRYDPRAETAVVSLPSGQWAFHLKGKDSDNVLITLIHTMLQGTFDFGFSSVLQAMVDSGRMSMTPQDHNMDASTFAEKLKMCEAGFNKFTSRTSAVKELTDQLMREPMMVFDTTTVNCVTNLAAFGNGVVPTLDIYDRTETGDFLTHPAGKLIPADIEFVLSSAAGLAWPTGDKFMHLMDARIGIEHGFIEGGWDGWLDVALQYANMILEKSAPTYRDFLNHAFPSEENAPPEEKDAFLRLLGAAVFGSNLKILAAMIGAPNSGKDTVLKWLSMILGSDQVGVLSSSALTMNADEQRGFAPLKGARIAVVSGEVGEGRTTAILAEKVKSITSGGGLLTVAEKYEKPTTIFFDGMLIMQGNSVPTIHGGDKALYKNRLVAVEFKHPFKLQANSYEREYRKEVPYFIQVLFIHFLDYVERGGGMVGIDPPKVWRDFGSDVEFSADPLAVIGRCLTKPDKADYEIQSPVFYKALSILAEKNLGIRYPMSANKWAAHLRKWGIVLTKDTNTQYRTRMDRSDYRGWVMHFSLDADNSDGLFSQRDWTNALEYASVALNS